MLGTLGTPGGLGTLGRAALGVQHLLKSVHCFGFASVVQDLVDVGLSGYSPSPPPLLHCRTHTHKHTLTHTCVRVYPLRH